jgi:hypothetical protein
MPATVQSRNARIFLLTVIGAIPFGWRAVASVSLGGGIQMVNLRALERSVGGMLSLAQQGRGSGLHALLGFRQLLLLGMVGAVLVTKPVQPLAFAVGLSTVVPAVIWHGLVTARPDA